MLYDMLRMLLIKFVKELVEESLLLSESTQLLRPMENYTHLLSPL